MGIKPSGLGLRLISLQFQPKLALAGERCPFDTFPLPFATAGIGGVSITVCVAEVLATVRPDILSTLKGLLLLDLALLKSLLESSSISSSIGVWAATLFFLADLVMGPKYPFCDSSFTSEGVGEGEMTLGVAGIELDEYVMLKGCKQGIRITPVKMSAICEARRNQWVE
jgi:hypothetical protein